MMPKVLKYIISNSIESGLWLFNLGTKPKEKTKLE